MIESHTADHSKRCGIIFDLDGTLADTLDDIASALNTALRSIGRPEAPRDVVRTWIGDGLPTLCRRALPDVDAETLQRFILTALDAYRRHPLDHTTLYPGIRELLDELHRRGVPMAVLSNKPHELTVKTVAGLHIGDRFRVIRGYVSEAEKKPSPTAALAIAGDWNLAPASVMFVGDSTADVATALAAAMEPIAVTWGFCSREQLAAAGATCFIDHPSQLVALLAAR